jgi:hypothetical protein
LGNDPVCNGTGFLWETPYGALTCWRCAGTGGVPELVPPKEKGKLSPEAVDDGIDGITIDTKEATNEGNA